jgi:DHA1 family inner membrane transport protein
VPLATTIGTATTWRIAFAALAVSFVAAAVLVHVLVPTQLRKAARAPSTTAVLTAGRQPQLLRVGMTIIVLSAARFATYTYMEPILPQAGVTPAGITAVLLGYGAAGVAAWA